MGMHVRRRRQSEGMLTECRQKFERELSECQRQRAEEQAEGVPPQPVGRSGSSGIRCGSSSAPPAVAVRLRLPPDPWPRRLVDRRSRRPQRQPRVSPAALVQRLGLRRLPLQPK